MIQLYIHIYLFFQIIFPYRLLKNIEYNYLCYTVGPCWLSVLYIVVGICYSQTPNLSLPTHFVNQPKGDLALDCFQAFLSGRSALFSFKIDCSTWLLLRGNVHVFTSLEYLRMAIMFEKISAFPNRTYTFKLPYWN